jgi:hypothetical protein
MNPGKTIRNIGAIVMFIAFPCAAISGALCGFLLFAGLATVVVGRMAE